MLTLVSGNSANEVWIDAARLLQDDNITADQGSRVGETKELLHVGFSIADPRQRWVFARTPGINPAFALAEIVWILNGSNDASFINHWNPILPNYAGKDDYYHGAYGYRLRYQFCLDQLSRAYNTLKNNPDSRQIVLQIWDSKMDLPLDNGQPVSSDIPCNICSLVKVRSNKLEWMQIIRSNDLFLGLPYNFIQFTTLQEVLSGWLEIELGTYNQISDSLHVYKSDQCKIDHLLKGCTASNKDILAVPKDESDLLFRQLYEKMDMMRKKGLKKSDFTKLTFLNTENHSYLNMLYLIAADSARRRGWIDEAYELAKRNSNPIYDLLWNRWVSNTERRKNYDSMNSI
jgi:thymidylate synthase